MKLKTFLSVIIPTAIIAIVAVLLSMFWPAITGTIKGESYYTGKDVQNSYDQGFKDGNKNETELNAKLNYYETIVDDYTKSISQLNAEISNLNKHNTDYQTQIKNLEQTKATNLETIQNLQTINSNNETTIANLNTQISNLKKQVRNLTNSGEDKSEQITILNNQITNLQNTISQLNTTNELNTNTITSLNTQIANLNSQISEMTLLSQNSQSQINTLNNKITELQKSVTYYESYIASLENGEQVVATFEFDGSVYNIQIVNKGSRLAVTNPTSTTYKIFNGWTVNGQTIDLNTYIINTNTKIVADVTYKYNVKFMVDDSVCDSQIITKNGQVTLPTNPTKDGYEFDGWSLNGVDVITDIAIKQVTSNTTYVAVFTKLHTVTFMSDGQTISTQAVRNGACATLPTNPTKDGYEFIGWSINSVDVISDFENIQIFVDTTYTSIFNKVADWVYSYLIGPRTCYSTGVWTDGTNYYYSYKTEHYVLDKSTSIWKEKTWKGLTSFRGSSIWTDGENIYYSKNSEQYVLDKSTSTWNIKTWKGLTSFSAGSVWTDGTNYYYSYETEQYVLDKSTSTWNIKTWNGLTSFNAGSVWTDGTNYYYSNDSKQFVLDKSTSTWDIKTWNGLTEFDGRYLWTDGTNIYCSFPLFLGDGSYVCQHYALDKSTFTWNIKTWNGLTNFDGRYVWTDGTNIYYSDNGGSVVYKFVK